MTESEAAESRDSEGSTRDGEAPGSRKDEPGAARAAREDSSRDARGAPREGSSEGQAGKRSRDGKGRRRSGRRKRRRAGDAPAEAGGGKPRTGRTGLRREARPDENRSRKKRPSRRNLLGTTLLVMALAGLAVAALFIFLPFVSTLTTAVLITTVAYPLFMKVLSFVGTGRRGLASGLTCVLVILLVVLPAFVCGWGIAHEVGNLLDGERRRGRNDGAPEARANRGSVGAPAAGAEDSAPGDSAAGDSEAADSGAAETTAGEAEEWWNWSRLVEAGSVEFELQIAKLKRDLRALTALQEAADPSLPERAPDDPPPAAVDGTTEKPRLTIPSGAFGAVANVVRWVTRFLGTLLAGVGGVVVKCLLMVFIMFYFFKDGPRIVDSVRRALSVDSAYQDKVIEKFKVVTVGMLRGILATALTQGVVAGVAFAFLGFPPFLVGSLVALCALVPVVGTGLVTLPLTIYLLIQAQTAAVEQAASGYGYVVAAGIFAVLISSLDNILRPLFVQGELKLHPVWILLSILGGVGCFGPLGLILGPMVVVLLRTVLALVAEESERRVLERA